MYTLPHSDGPIFTTWYKVYITSTRHQSKTARSTSVLIFHVKIHTRIMQCHIDALILTKQDTYCYSNEHLHESQSIFLYLYTNASCPYISRRHSPEWMLHSRITLYNKRVWRHVVLQSIYTVPNYKDIHLYSLHSSLHECICTKSAW